jgi:hypothetical protein
MFAGDRIALAFPLSLAVALALSACDVSQKKPETFATLTTQWEAGSLVRSHGTADADAPTANPAPAAQSERGERSVRLFGPGISRERQTRI